MRKTATYADRVKSLAKARGVLRPRDLAAESIPRAVLSRLCSKGELTRTGRGLYVLEVGDITENHAFAEIARRVPKGVICLLSALRFHGLTTQLPSEVWVAIAPKARRPNGAGLSVRPVHFSGDALEEGIEVHEIEKVPVRIYNAGKTVADCFKHRNKIGMDVAREALRDCWTKRKATADEIWRYAKMCRVAKIMQPYMESLT